MFISKIAFVRSSFLVSLILLNSCVAFGKPMKRYPPKLMPDTFLTPVSVYTVEREDLGWNEESDSVPSRGVNEVKKEEHGNGGRSNMRSM